MRPVILSGGSGTRLWPVSRESYPKQFCEFFDRSFLVNTWDRVSRLGSPLVVTLDTMGPLTLKALGPRGLKSEDLLLEPIGKNTAAAVALACHILESRGQGDEILGVFPADHVVADEESFLRAVKLGEKAASDGFVVTLAIQPRYPSTGFGYIETSDEVLFSEKNIKALKVASFREKPKQDVANTYFKSGRHYWNAGIFIFRARDMSQLMQKHLPEAWARIKKITPDFSNVKITYANLESISLDHAIAEKITNLACIPCEMGWSDVGSWDEISRLTEDVKSLRIDSKAKVFRVGSSTSFFYSTTAKTVGLVDAEDLLIVDTQDALLISKKGQSEKVREVVSAIKGAGLASANEHVFEDRPWGRYEVLRDEEKYKVKKISVDPGQRLSYQSHEKRSEAWIVIEGEAEVTLDDQVKTLKVGELIRIPAKAKHRVRNPGKTPLVFVEVQTGQYFGEDDIQRYSDDYNRV